MASEDGKDEIKYEVFNFTGPGVALSMYNLDNQLKTLRDLVLAMV